MSESPPPPHRPIHRGPYPELTAPALLIGYGLGVMIALAIGYAALILGFSISGSELAAILGFVILRGLLRRGSIIENNINQTVASTVNGASAGMMFSVPALFILGYTTADFNVPFMVMGCIVGAILGIAFIIPLRKQMIDFNRLAYPGGIAVAAVLKSPGAGMRKAVLLAAGALVSAIVHLVIAQIMDVRNVDVGAYLGLPAYMNAVFYVSLLTIGVGFLAGRGGVFFIIGGYTCYWVLAPILSHVFGAMPSGSDLVAYDVENALRAMITAGHLPATDNVETVFAYLRELFETPLSLGIGAVTTVASALPPATQSPEYLRAELFEPLGIGMLIGGALMGMVIALPLIVSAITSMQAAAKNKSALSKDEMPIKLLGIAVLGAFVVLLVIAVKSTGDMTLARGATMALLGTVWIWIAGVILSECIGRTAWSPLSGMTLIGVTILIFIASGLGDAQAIVASIMVGAAMCVAMSQATDLMTDLKAGYLVGATPRKQQIAQFAATWLGPIVVMGLILVLHQAMELGSDALPAPQGQALAGMIGGILGDDVPTHQYAAGAGLGAILSASGVTGLGVLVGLGFYLPFNIVLTYTIGTVLRLVADWKKGKLWSENVGIPIAAGLLIGEALVGVGAAIYHIIGAAT